VKSKTHGARTSLGPLAATRSRYFRHEKRAHYRRALFPQPFDPLKTFRR
jgi:hypothetical protein